MRSRRNNTTLTRKVDKWNPRKVWLIKRYADGHYAINQEVGGRVFLFQLPESNQGTDRCDLRLLLIGEANAASKNRVRPVAELWKG